jgi:hypothetical protein
MNSGYWKSQKAHDLSTFIFLIYYSGYLYSQPKKGCCPAYFGLSIHIAKKLYLKLKVLIKSSDYFIFSIARIQP